MYKLICSCVYLIQYLTLVIVGIHMVFFPHVYNVFITSACITLIVVSIVRAGMFYGPPAYRWARRLIAYIGLDYQ